METILRRWLAWYETEDPCSYVDPEQAAELRELAADTRRYVDGFRRIVYHDEPPGRTADATERLQRWNDRLMPVAWTEVSEVDWYRTAMGGTDD